MSNLSNKVVGSAGGGVTSIYGSTGAVTSLTNPLFTATAKLTSPTIPVFVMQDTGALIGSTTQQIDFTDSAGTVVAYLDINGTAVSLNLNTLTGGSLTFGMPGGTVTIPDVTTTLVGRDTTDTLTNKTIGTADITTKAITETTTSNTAINLANGSVFYFPSTKVNSVVLPDYLAGKSFTVIWSFSATVPATLFATSTGGTTVRWPAATQPTATANGTSVFTFIADGASSWLGAMAMDNT